MDKWPEDYECDGQMSLFPVRFEDCLNPPETDYQSEVEHDRVQNHKDNRRNNPHKQDKTEDKAKAVEIIQKAGCAELSG